MRYKHECWRRVTISGIKVENVNIRNILLARVNTDFGIRQPSIRGECYLINHAKSLILDLYDDRGMDVVAFEKEALLDLYHSHNELILDFDRERIDRVFS